MTKLKTRKLPKGKMSDQEVFSPHGLEPSHQDFARLRQLERAILRHSGGYERFCEDIPQLFRQAMDEVIDAPRSKRFTIKEIEKTEKTYIGTKVEILVRNHLNIPKGKTLDLAIDGIEVDIKNTVGNNWMIPLEAIGHPCILIKLDEETAKCSFGIIVIRQEILNKVNRDKKASIKAKCLASVHWMLRDAAYPENFWEGLSAETKQQVMSPPGGTERVAVLFRRHQGRPISRKLVEALAQQSDPTRRIRKNGGARDPFQKEGIVLLSGQVDRKLIEELGLPSCKRDEFIAFQPNDENHLRLLRDAKKIS
jgi:hypothetical protein